MKRFLLVVVALSGLGGIVACNKPAADDCRKAITNMEVLLGTTNVSKADDIEAEVRRCTGGSTKKWVACAIGATTLEQLKACGSRASKKE